MSAALGLIAYAKGKDVEIRLVEGRVRLSGLALNVKQVAGPLRQYRDELLCWFQQEHGQEKKQESRKVLLEAGALPSKNYYAHHFCCPTCISAGKQGGLRCFTGLELWGAYLQWLNSIHSGN